ncbi:dienelactone hydrolase family protein [Klebsiella pneumoniae subsp. pneumoniae]|nr:dienelactone hydrolase family protein [Klebsiella pneumoniae subsp. pneumoniae]
MTRLTAKDFPQQLLEYYDYYAHGKISKREFLQLAGKYTVGGMTALALFNLLKPDYALAEQVPFTDPDIRPEYIHYPSPDGHGEVRAYLVTPTKIADKAPAVVVVHENRGLNPYIEDVARRVAKAGYIALAPDGLSAVGGYPGNDDEGRALQQKVDPVKLMNDFFAAVAFMANYPQATGRSVSPVFATAAASAATRRRWRSRSWPDAVPFYGRQPPLKEVDKIKAPLLLHYAGLDSGINEGWPAYEQALKEHHKVYEAYFYQGVNHGFHNDSTPRYDRAAADLAWQRTLAWFEKYLR